jgi:hypothetical protein
MSQVKRLMIVLWLPPLLAVALSEIFTVFLLPSRGNLSLVSVKDTLTALPLIGIFAFGYCLIPSLGSWGLLELAWKFGPERLKNLLPSQLMGGLLGLTSGAVINGFAYTSGHRWAHFLSGPGTGFVCGAAVATFIRSGCFRSPVQTPTDGSIGIKQNRPAIRIFRTAILIAATVVGSAAVLLAGFRGIVWWQYRLPSESHVHNQFNAHRSDFERFVETLKTDPKTRFIGDGGRIYDDGIHFRVVEKYRDLMNTIGAKSVRVQEDGTVDFTMGGFGGAIISDSYIGLRFRPGPSTAKRGDWGMTVVESLKDDKLPHENGRVASGVYVVPIEPNWYLYRFEYQE